MKSRSVSVIFLLAVLILSSLACNLSTQPITRELEFVSVSVDPAESDGADLRLVVTYKAVGAEDRVTIYCFYQSISGPTAIGLKVSEGFADARTLNTIFSFSVTKPGVYQAYCKSSDGAQSSTASFNVVETGVLITEPQNQPSTANTACKWQVAGTWNITQVNNYHPTFEINQTGTILVGSATLSAGEASMGGYTGTTGTGEGSADGNMFTFVVTWPPKTDGQVISGTYTGTITEGRIDGKDNVWYGTGPSRCVNP